MVDMDRDKEEALNRLIIKLSVGSWWVMLMMYVVYSYSDSNPMILS